MYPTLEEVESADRYAICKWWRFLKSPGERAIGRPEFEEVLQKEKVVMDRIAERYKELGGMTPAISKSLGWRG
jgi:hypothetical protein